MDNQGESYTLSVLWIFLCIVELPTVRIRCEIGKFIKRARGLDITRSFCLYHKWVILWFNPKPSRLKLALPTVPLMPVFNRFP